VDVQLGFGIRNMLLFVSSGFSISNHDPSAFIPRIYPSTMEFFLNSTKTIVSNICMRGQSQAPDVINPRAAGYNTSVEEEAAIIQLEANCTRYALLRGMVGVGLAKEYLWVGKFRSGVLRFNI